MKHHIFYLSRPFSSAIKRLLTEVQALGQATHETIDSKTIPLKTEIQIQMTANMSSKRKILTNQKNYTIASWI